MFLWVFIPRSIRYMRAKCGCGPTVLKIKKEGYRQTDRQTDRHTDRQTQKGALCPFVCLPVCLYPSFFSIRKINIYYIFYIKTIFLSQYWNHTWDEQWRYFITVYLLLFVISLSLSGKSKWFTLFQVLNNFTNQQWSGGLRPPQCPCCLRA